MALNIDLTKEVKSLDALLALSIVGNEQCHPDILLRERDYDIALVCFTHTNQCAPNNLAQLLTPEIEIQVEQFIANLRWMYQRAFDQLAIDEEKKSATQEASARYAASVKLREAGKEFIKNNTNDYGGKTVAQLAEELGISKGEVRRRKANGEL